MYYVNNSTGISGFNKNNSDGVQEIKALRKIKTWLEEWKG